MSSAPECIGYVETLSLRSILYKTCLELISTLSNSSSSARSTSSASAGWSSEHKSVRLPRRMIASIGVDGQLPITHSQRMSAWQWWLLYRRPVAMHLPCRALAEAEEHDRSAQMIWLCCIHVLPQTVYWRSSHQGFSVTEIEEHQAEVGLVVVLVVVFACCRRRWSLHIWLDWVWDCSRWPMLSRYQVQPSSCAHRLTGW